MVLKTIVKMSGETEEPSKKTNNQEIAVGDPKGAPASVGLRKQLT